MSALKGLRMKHVVLLIALVIPTAGWGAAHCSNEESKAAEEVAPLVNTWPALQRAFKQYGHCDDGGIGEGFSESVARLLTNSDPKLHELLKLSKTDPGFRAFVLRHVDATLLPEQLNAIERQVARNCPSGGELLCRDISSSARKAKSELSRYLSPKRTN